MTTPFNNQKRILSALICSASATALLLPAAAIHAADENVLEEIIVTGTKRDTALQQTPLAVSTFTGQEISNTFVNDIRAIADMAPNVLLTVQPGFNAVAGGIRGTGTTSILVTQDPSVSVTVDDFALGSVQSQFIEMFDVQQVEIYRGPQGTLFGANSTGGVIAFTTKRPNLEEFGGDIEATFNQYEGARDADGLKLTASMDIPLIENKLGLRFAGVFDQHEGWMTNSKDTATFPEVIPIFGAFGLPSVNPPLPPELDTTTRGAGEELGDKEVYAFKTKLLWAPNDTYEALFSWEVSRDSSGSPAAINETPVGENFLWDALGFPGVENFGFDDVYATGVTQQGNGINILAGHQMDVDGYFLTQKIALKKFDVTILLGQRDTEETMASTYTGEAFNNLFDASRNMEREQQQAEIRFVSNFDGPINFVTGGVYFTDDLDFRVIATQGLASIIPTFNNDTGSFYDERGFVNLDLDPLNDPSFQGATQDRESYGVYLDGTWDLSEKLTISAGIRFTHDEKDYHRFAEGGGVCNEYTKEKDAILADPSQPFDYATNCAADVRSNAISRAGMTGREYDPRTTPLPDENFSVSVFKDDEWEETTWRLAVDYKFTDEQMMYASVATGFISGGFSETCSTILTCGAYDPETNTNYEIGYKADFLNNTLRINTAIFYTEFEDLQRSQVVPFTSAAGDPAQETITVNAGESTHYGLEIEATWLATERLTLRGSLGLLEAEYDEFEWDPQPNNPATGLTDFSSLDIPFVSPVQANLDATYNWPLSNGALLSLNANVVYQDEAETAPFDTNGAAATPAVIRHPTNTQVEEFTLINAHVTYRDADDRYHLTLYGRNLTDENTRTGANSVADLWVMSFFSAPREIGFRIGANF